jgi:hypothetical protein
VTFIAHARSFWDLLSLEASLRVGFRFAFAAVEEVKREHRNNWNPVSCAFRFSAQRFIISKFDRIVYEPYLTCRVMYPVACTEYVY